MEKMIKKVIARRNGNSVAVTIPTSMCCVIGLQIDSVLNAELTEDMKIILTPIEV